MNQDTEMTSGERNNIVSKLFIVFQDLIEAWASSLSIMESEVQSSELSRKFSKSMHAVNALDLIFQSSSGGKPAF